MNRATRSHLMAAVVGGLVVAGGLLVVGLGSPARTETVIQEAPLAAATGSPGLTAHDIYQRYAPGVVYLSARVIAPTPSPFGPAGDPDTGISTGAGFLVDRRGDIITNYHEIAGAVQRGGVSVKFESGVLRQANVVAIDQDQNLAVLRVSLDGVPARPLRLGDSTTVQVGDPTLAIGNPQGLGHTLSSGIVSTLVHQIAAAGGLAVGNVIQTDQPLDAGYSGGPLLDGAGRVVGINSQVTGADGQAVSFATPIDTAGPILSRAQHGGPLTIAYLGLRTASARGDHPALTVTTVQAGSPAQQGGLRRGDAISKLDGYTVSSPAALQALVRTRTPGQTLSVEIRRRGLLRTVRVRLGSQP